VAFVGNGQRVSNKSSTPSRQGLRVTNESHGVWRHSAGRPWIRQRHDQRLRGLCDDPRRDGGLGAGRHWAGAAANARVSREFFDRRQHHRDSHSRPFWNGSSGDSRRNVAISNESALVPGRLIGSHTCKPAAAKERCRIGMVATTRQRRPYMAVGSGGCDNRSVLPLPVPTEQTQRGEAGGEEGEGGGDGCRGRSRSYKSAPSGTTTFPNATTPSLP
jgi:hypothetical protein